MGGTGFDPVRAVPWGMRHPSGHPLEWGSPYHPRLSDLCFFVLILTEVFTVQLVNVSYNMILKNKIKLNFTLLKTSFTNNNNH